MSDALAPRTALASDAASTSSLIPVVRGPITSSPPSSPTLPQLPSPPSVPNNRPAATQHPKSVDKKRARSRSQLPAWSRWRGWFAPPQQIVAQVLRTSKSCILAFKIASLCLNREALPLWALSALAGLSIVDSLSDNVILNLGFGLVHVVALKTFTWSEE